MRTVKNEQYNIDIGIPIEWFEGVNPHSMDQSRKRGHRDTANSTTTDTQTGRQTPSQTQTSIGCQRLVCPCSSAHSIRYVRSLLAKRSRVPAQSLGVVTAKRDRDARRFNKNRKTLDCGVFGGKKAYAHVEYLAKIFTDFGTRTIRTFRTHFEHIFNTFRTHF